MWVALSEKTKLEEELFHFLISLRDEQPRAAAPLAPDPVVLQSLYSDPHPDLLKALQHCLDVLLVEMHPDPARFGRLEVSPSALGVALAAHNCLATPATEFTQALIASLPPPGGRDMALTYHAILRGIATLLPDLEINHLALFYALIECSPLTTLSTLDIYTPAIFDEVAAELLVGWRKAEKSQTGVWADLQQWSDVVSGLLADEHIARWLRQRWQEMPETRLSCRNIGLALEVLRRKRTSNAFMMEFYESYCFFRSEVRADERLGKVRVWPTLEIIEKLLRVSGDSEAAIKLNRRGGEYFLKFRPLVMVIIKKKGIAAPYKRLTLDFQNRLRRLLNYVTENSRKNISFGQVEFEDSKK